MINRGQTNSNNKKTVQIDEEVAILVLESLGEMRTNLGRWLHGMEITDRLKDELVKGIKANGYEVNYKPGWGIHDNYKVEKVVEDSK